ncbi:MAG: trimethylamine methyltransferase [Rhodobacteraceae bacterium]|nr:trimethylamine methyltransferase [Paracoccaceae bacterium]
MTRSARNSGGRKARVAKRVAREPEVNPAPPGQTGGRYKPLRDYEIQAIFNTALRLLAELGMGEVPEVLKNRCLEKGASVNDSGRLCFPNRMVRDIINGAAKTITLHGRDPARSIEVGGNTVHFGTGGAAVRTLDLDSGRYRPSTLQDLYDFTRLQDTLTNVSWFTRCCVASDVADNFDQDINTAYALLRGTTKPVATSFYVAENIEPIIQMFDLAAGGPGEFAKRPWCVAHISPVISPLRYGTDAVEVALECIRHGVPVSCITAAQSGATAPAPPAGFLASSLAETLASLIMVNVFAPGFPMVFSNWPFVIDLRTGAFAGAGGETAVMNAASAQISNWLGLPSGVSASMSDAKAVDAQMGMEKGITALAAGLAGGNMVYESSGMTASLLGASFEAFVIDDEMHSHIYRAIRGIEVNEETLGYDAICAAVLGDGHFLGGQQTLDAMQRDYYYPTLADRKDPETWADEGASDIWQRARGKARGILESHHPTYLNPEIDKIIRRKFNILLD